MAKNHINILSISFSNFLSFKNETNIFFTEETRFSSQKDQWNLIDTNSTEDKVLPVTVFYGANASGKTNILKVLLAFRSLLGNSERIIPNIAAYKPFALDIQNTKKNAEIRITVCFNNQIITYALQFNRKIIKEENLLVNNISMYKRNNDQLDFFDQNISVYDREYIKDTLSKRPDIAMLELIAKRGLKLYSEIYTAFKNLFSNFAPLDDKKLEFLHKNPKILDKINKWLRLADIGLSRIEIEKYETSNDDRIMEKHIRDFISNITHTPEIEKTINKYKYRLKFYHITGDNKEYSLDSMAESDGTVQYLKKITSLYSAFLNGGIFIDDEIENSLHPLLIQTIIKAFNNPKINKGGAQLICTTHDVNLLKKNVLRRDEIWFVEKNLNGESMTYPLSEFRDIRNNYDYEKGYLDGRFGAIPFLGDIDELEQLMEF